MTDDEPLGDIANEIRDRTGEERPETGEERPETGEERPETGGQRRERSPDSEVTDPKRREGPLADVAAAVDERRRRKRTDSGDPFESVDVGELDGEKLWTELAERDDGDETTDAGTTATDTATTGTATADTASVTSSSGDSSPESTGLIDEDVMDDWPEDDSADEWEDDDWDDGQDVRTIPKETCQGCPHVGDPPELHCTHEGTEILSMPDTDHFRVVDCPMAVDDEELDLEIGPDDE